MNADSAQAESTNASPREAKPLQLTAIGLAMFSMFFGSGNIVFPVLIGQATQSQAPFAMLGLLLTAVMVPFLGLMALSLFDGRYLDFFKRLGILPGWFVLITIMGLLGPFAVIPRCIVISHATISTFLPHMDLPLFSLISCGLIYICTYTERKVLEVLGLYLTPVLLLALLAIVILGFLAPGHMSPSSFTSLEALGYGLVEGYKTMDLFASFMFSSVVLTGIKQARPDIVTKPRQLLAINLRASLIGMGLLAFIYIGMSYVAARHGADLVGVSQDQLLSQLTLRILGPYAGIVVCIAVSLACLTTAISLALVFTEFICQEASGGRWKYKPTLLGTLGISFVISTLRFTGIQSILAPVLKLGLPALLVLTVFNFLHKLYGLKTVKAPVYTTFVLTLAYHLWTRLPT